MWDSAKIFKTLNYKAFAAAFAGRPATGPPTAQQRDQTVLFFTIVNNSFVCSRTAKVI
jgi:hypothetical protein